MKSIQLFWCPGGALGACFGKGLSIYTLISFNYTCLKAISFSELLIFS